MDLRPDCRQRGFTMLELVVAIAIVAILASMAVPSFLQTFARNQTSSYTNDLVAALNLARSEAVAKRVSTKVCTSSSASACRAPADANALAWGKGWLVMDTDNNRVVAYHGELTGTVVLSSAVPSITFDASGAMTSTNQADFYLRTASCTNKGDRLVRLSGSGRISVFPVACS